MRGHCITRNRRARRRVGHARGTVGVLEPISGGCLGGEGMPSLAAFDSLIYMEVTIAAGARISLPRFIPFIMAPTLQQLRRSGQDLDLLGQGLGQHNLRRLALPGLLVGEVSRR